MFYLGVDIAKTNHVASLLNSDGDVIIKAIKFTNSKEGFNKLLTSLASVTTDYGEVLVSMEATGIYWLALFSALEDKGFKVSVINPFHIKAYREVFNNRKQKNDVIDSVLIADYLRVFRDTNTSLPNEELLSLRRLTRFKESLINDVSTHKARIVALLDLVFPEYNKAFSNIFGMTSSRVLSECPTPEAILKINSIKLSELLVSKGKTVKTSAKDLKDLASSSFGVKMTSDTISFEIKRRIEYIEFLKKQIDDLEEKILLLYTHQNTFLMSIPGIGKTTAPIILAEIGDINNFSSPAKLVAFAGIDPTENQSGDKASTNEITSKRGSPRLRHALYQSAFIASMHDPTLKAYYDKKKAEGKHHSVILGGIQRKLLHIIYYVLKEQREYRQPINQVIS